MTRPPHIPVLLAEVLEHLAPAPGQAIVDGTLGAGGYTTAILERGAAVVGIDRDPSAISAAQARGLENLTLVEGRFGDLEAHLDQLGIDQVDGFVLDLGVSSMQLDQAERGFSFRLDGPLDMRMGGEGPSAADLVASLSERALADILYSYGEERRSRHVAKAIVERRKRQPFTRTTDLAELVADVVGRSWKDVSHPATRSFQALRIAVNREFEEVARAIAAAERRLKPGGRLVVVTFHSLEDGLVKRMLATRAKADGGSRHMPAVQAEPPTFELLTRKAVAPSDGEIAANPRARSAKLRAARRTETPARRFDLAEMGLPTLDDLANRGGR